MEKFTFFYFFLFLSSFFLFFSFFCFSSFFLRKKMLFLGVNAERNTFFFFFESILDRWNCVWNVYLWGLFCPIKGIREYVWWYRWSFFVPFSSSQILRAIHWLEHIVVSARAEKAEETNVFFSPPLFLSIDHSFLTTYWWITVSSFIRPWLLTFDQKRLNMNIFIEPSYIKTLNQIKIAAWYIHLFLYTFSFLLEEKRGKIFLIFLV